eukprot:334699-Pelagomonas_calceolata.AAC.2
MCDAALGTGVTLKSLLLVQGMGRTYWFIARLLASNSKSTELVSANSECGWVLAMAKDIL